AAAEAPLEGHVDHARALAALLLAEPAGVGPGGQQRLEGLALVLGDLAVDVSVLGEVVQDRAQLGVGQAGDQRADPRVGLARLDQRVDGRPVDRVDVVAHAIALGVAGGVPPLDRVAVDARDQPVVGALAVDVLFFGVQRGQDVVGHAVGPDAAPGRDRLFLGLDQLGLAGLVVDAQHVGVALADLIFGELRAPDQDPAVGVGVAVGLALPDAVAAVVGAHLGEHEQLAGRPLAPHVDGAV